MDEHTLASPTTTQRVGLAPHPITVDELLKEIGIDPSEVKRVVLKETEGVREADRGKVGVHPEILGRLVDAHLSQSRQFWIAYLKRLIG
jgi:hypothetical protein